MDSSRTPGELVADVVRLDRAAAHWYAAGRTGERLGDEDVSLVGHRGEDASSTARGAGGGAGTAISISIKPRTSARSRRRSVGHSPGTDGKDVIGDDGHSADGQGQQRIREVAAECAREVRAHLGGVSNLPARRKSGRRMATSGVEGADGHGDRATLVNDWTTRMRNTGYNVHRREPDGSARTRIERPVRRA